MEQKYALRILRDFAGARKNELPKEMRYTYLIYAVGAALSVATLGSCSRADEIPFAGGEGQHSDATVEIALSIPSLATRTSVGEDDGRTLTPKWDVGDSFGLLIRSADGSELNERFDAACEFTHIENAHDLNNELFTGLVPRMASGTYDYYAIYPMPSEGSISGTTVRCTVPSIQTGEYDGGSDLMWAHAVGEELDQNLYNNLDLRFKHLTHALKITVPEELNRFGTEIERIAIEFPQPVAGDIVLNLEDGTVDTSTALSNVIEVYFDAEHPFVDGEPFWVYTVPVQIMGAVRFTAYNDSGSWMSTYVETNSFGELGSGRITPVSLAVTAGFQVTWFDYEIDWSQLGEPVERMTMKLPDGYVFADGNNERSVMNVDGRFSFPFRSEYLTSKQIEGLGSQPIEVTYESEHAIVPDKMTIEGEYILNQRNDMSAKAPYLFFEDFSTVEYFNYDYDHSGTGRTGTKKAYSFLGSSGWTGARIKSQLNTSISVACYRNQALFGSESINPGRVDSAPISRLKDGVSVNVSLQFRYSMDQDRTFGSDIAMTCYIGRVENPEGLNSDSEEGTFYDNFRMEDKNGSFTNLLYDYNHVIEACGNTSRLSWRVIPDSGSNNSNNSCWLFIDDVRVSIAPKE